MDRRKFLSTLIGGVAATAAVRTFPFRVYSFPKEIETSNWQGISIAPYPGRLATPFVRLSEMPALTPEMVREMMRRAQEIYIPGALV